jgi:hypothetical protein
VKLNGADVIYGVCMTSESLLTFDGE